MTRFARVLTAPSSWGCFHRISSALPSTERRSLGLFPRTTDLERGAHVTVNSKPCQARFFDTTATPTLHVQSPKNGPDPTRSWVNPPYCKVPVSSLAWSLDGSSISYVAPFDAKDAEKSTSGDDCAKLVRVTRRGDCKQDLGGYRGKGRPKFGLANVLVRTPRTSFKRNQRQVH